MLVGLVPRGEPFLIVQLEYTRGRGWESSDTLAPKTKFHCPVLVWHVMMSILPSRAYRKTVSTVVTDSFCLVHQPHFFCCYATFKYPIGIFQDLLHHKTLAPNLMATYMIHPQEYLDVPGKASQLEKPYPTQNPVSAEYSTTPPLPLSSFSPRHHPRPLLSVDYYLHLLQKLLLVHPSHTH